MPCPGAHAGDLWYEFSEQYLQRIEGITASVGNAKDINAVTHMIDPWPRYVRNRRIPANGERMTGAVDRYRQGRLQSTPPPIAPTYTTTIPSAASATAGATAATTGATATTPP
jgi:hypothetical protein